MGRGGEGETTQTCVIFVKQFLVSTVNHRGPLPLREPHSTDETIDRGGWEGVGVV